MQHPPPALPTTSPTRTAQSYRPTRPLLTRAGDAIGSGSAAAEHGAGSGVGRPLPSAGFLTLCCPSALIVAAPIRAASATGPRSSPSRGRPRTGSAPAAGSNPSVPASRSSVQSRWSPLHPGRIADDLLQRLLRVIGRRQAETDSPLW